MFYGSKSLGRNARTISVRREIDRGRPSQGEAAGPEKICCVRHGQVRGSRVTWSTEGPIRIEGHRRTEATQKGKPWENLGIVKAWARKLLFREKLVRSGGGAHNYRERAQRAGPRGIPRKRERFCDQGGTGHKHREGERPLPS